MEWTGRQQIVFLLQSVGLGAAQGFLLDLVTGISRFKKRQKWLLTDVVFGPIMAVITFFGALVIMDGQLHPVLLGGVFGGMFLEHILFGVHMARILRKLRFFVWDRVCGLCDFLRDGGGFLIVWIRKAGIKPTRRPQKSKKE